MMCRPVSEEPVKEISGTSGWSTRAWPASSPRPWTMFTTPAGTPASSKISGHSDADSGVHSAGLRISVQPDASAGASFQLSSMNGVFQGVISPATPTGVRTT